MFYLFSYDPDYESCMGESDIQLIGVFESEKEAEEYFYSDNYRKWFLEMIIEKSDVPINFPTKIF